MESVYIVFEQFWSVADDDWFMMTGFIKITQEISQWLLHCGSRIDVRRPQIYLYLLPIQFYFATFFCAKWP